MINYCDRVDTSTCPKIRSKQYFHRELLVEIQGEQRQCPAQHRPPGCSGGSNTRPQIILMQNKQKTNVQCENSAEEPADSGVRAANLKTCSLAVLLWLCCKV